MGPWSPVIPAILVSFDPGGDIDESIGKEVSQSASREYLAFEFFDTTS